MDDAAPFALLLLPIFYIVILAVVIFPHWKMFQRAGYSGALSLLLILPIINIIVLFWFGLSDWPALRGRRGGM